MMSKSFGSVFLLLTSALLLTACGSQTADKPLAPVASTSPTVSAPADSPSPIPQATSSPSTAPQAYVEKNGLFEISFPRGYKYKETGSGVAFISDDQHFGGSVNFGPARGKQLTAAQLEQALKAEYENRLDQVTWQKSAVQPDGSMRVDWVGKDKDGSNLDAVSFIEQRGDNIFILDLVGINKAYQGYNSDAEAIVANYHVHQQ